MTTHQNQNGETDVLDPKAVADFLRQHPDFFTKHINLLAELQIPHGTGKAVSLIERQVDVLREQNRRYRKQLQELIQIARDNDRLIDHLQNLTLALMDTDDISQALILVEACLRHDLQADAATLCLYTGPGDIFLESQVYEFLDILPLHEDSPLVNIKKSLLLGDPVCGRLKQDQVAFLFGRHNGPIASAALVPLPATPPYAEHSRLGGILAIGSERNDRFHAEMGTMFLTYLGQLISRKLRPYFTSAASP